MAISVYQINKGINKPIEFKGLKAQYIWYMGGILLILLVVYIILYMTGINQYLCVGLVLVTGMVLTRRVFGMSKRYGQHGLMKLMAKRMIPEVVRCNNRNLFIRKGNKESGI